MTTVHQLDYHNKTIYAIKNDASRYTWAGYVLFVLISSLVGDTTILIASFKYRAFNLHKVVVVIIQHIAFCDLMLTAMFVFPRFIALVSNEWALGNSLCYLAPYMNYYFAGAGTLLICNMTTSKLVLLKYPLRCETISVKKAHMFCLACWLAALIAPVTIFLVIILDGDDTYFSYISYFCNFGFMSDIWRWLQPLLTFLCMFVPNVLVVGTTIYLLIIAKQVACRGRESLKWQGIMTTVLTATVYCLSILPYAVYNIGELMIN